MALTSSSVIEKGAERLLSLLATQSPIRYNRFYDGTEETAARLAKAPGFDESDRSWYCAQQAIDLAVFELSKLGLLETSQLDETLSDGERDYEILLTAKGKRQVLLKSKLTFWDAE